MIILVFYILKNLVLILKMLKQCLRKFAYIPKQPLTFKDGKSLIMEENNIGNLEILLRASSCVLVPFSILVTNNIPDIIMNAAISMLPFLCYHIHILMPFSLCIKRLYLDEDGKNIWVEKYLSKTLHKVNISKLEFEEMKRFKKFNPIKKILVINPKLSAYISKSSDIYYEDVLDKILEGKEIQVSKSNK